MSMDYSELDQIYDYCRYFLMSTNYSEASEEEQEVLDTMESLCDLICDLAY